MIKLHKEPFYSRDNGHGEAAEQDTEEHGFLGQVAYFRILGHCLQVCAFAQAPDSASILSSVKQQK